MRPVLARRAPGRRWLAAWAVVAAVAAGCSSAGGAPTIHLGALYPTTGPQSADGREEAWGAELAVDWANAHGGVLGARIQLHSVDAPRPEAVPEALAALRGRGVSVVMGSHSSAVSAVAAKAATDNGMLLWETGAVGEVPADADAGRSFFRLAPTGANLGQAAVGFVRDELAPKLGGAGPLRYAVAEVDDVYGRSVGSGAVAEIHASGQALAGVFPYDAHTADFGDVAARIAAAHPDVLFVAAYLDDGVALREATVAGGVRLRASIGTSSSYCMPAFGDRLGADAVGLFASDKPEASFVRPEALTAEGRRTLEWAESHYRSRHHAAMSAAALAGFANGYALVAHVVPAARSSSAAAVADAALRVKLAPGTLPNGAGLDLAPPGAPTAGTNAKAASVIWEWIAPAQRAVVWPPAFATHPITALPLAP